jgi:hypothetical protein
VILISVLNTYDVTQSGRQGALVAKVGSQHHA